MAEDNKLLTPDLIAQESLMVLENNLVLGKLVNRNYSSEFTGSNGDTITIRKPNEFKTKVFNGEIELQSVQESGVEVKLDLMLDISFGVKAKDMTLSITNFSEQFIQPALRDFAQTIDERLAALAMDIPYHVGTAGVTPNAVTDITALRKVMNDNKVPTMGRNLVLDTAADAKLLSLDAFSRVDASGSSEALVNATLGRKFGFDCYMDQNIAVHSNDDLTFTAPKTNAAVDPGATAMAITDSAMTGTIKKGTLFTVAGSEQQFVVTEDVTAVGNSAIIKFYPAVKEGIAETSAISFVGTHALNIAFNKNAFSLVSRPLAKPLGLTTVSNISYNNLGLRVAYGYDIRRKQDIISIDGLFGVKTLMPELACVLLG